MLVLVAGVTGRIAQHIVDSLSARGHQIRGLARSYDKLDEAHRKKLHSFVEMKHYDDVDALDRACKGVDAIICAYTGVPEMTLDAQLILIRAAERAGVTRYIASSWNYDWRRMKLGQHESYDPYIAFDNHIGMTSSIKPTYIFVGVFAELFFSVPGNGFFYPQYGGCWDPEKKTMDAWGTGEETWHWTTVRDAADFAADIVARDEVPKGGFWSVCSGENTPQEMAQVYEKVRGHPVAINMRGSVEKIEGSGVGGAPQWRSSKLSWIHRLVLPAVYC